MILIAACSAASQAANYTMFRNPNCGCCLAWAEHIKQGKKDAVTTVDHPDMMTLKSQHGVPDDLRSCHTMIAEGYVIEGHVPAADVKRLLAEKPNALGTLVGAMLVSTLENGLTILAVSYYVLPAVKGGVLALALIAAYAGKKENN